MTKVKCNIKYDFNPGINNYTSLFFIDILSLVFSPFKKLIPPRLSKFLVTKFFSKNKHFLELKKIIEPLKDKMPDLLENISKITDNYDWELHFSFRTFKEPKNGETKLTFFAHLESINNKKIPRFWLNVIEEPELHSQRRKNLKPLEQTNENQMCDFYQLREIYEYCKTMKQYYIIHPKEDDLYTSINSFRNYISKINKNTILFVNNRLDPINISPFKNIINSFDNFIKDKKSKNISPLEYGEDPYTYSHVFYIQKSLEWSVKIEEDIYDAHSFESLFYPSDKTSPIDIFNAIADSKVLKELEDFKDIINENNIDDILTQIKLMKY